MAGADDDSTAWAAQFAALLAGQAAAALELFGQIAAEAQAGDEAEWVRSAERIEVLWRQFVQEHSEAFVAAWPEIVRHLTSLLPLLSRGQPLFAMLAQLWPLLIGPELLGRAIGTRGESLIEALEQFLADPASIADGHHAEVGADDPTGRDQALP
jgi:hypothetical protein